jgi:hypothetical protein
MFSRTIDTIKTKSLTYQLEPTLNEKNNNLPIGFDNCPS